MSFHPALWGLSNPGVRPWVITVTVILVIVWAPAAQVVSASTDVLGLLAVLLGSGGGAVWCCGQTADLPKPL